LYESVRYSSARFPGHRTRRRGEDANLSRLGIILFFLACAFVAFAFLGISSFCRSLGLAEQAFAAWIFGSVLLFVTVGFGVTFGFAYLVTSAAVRRAVDERLRRMDRERQAQELARRMYGLDRRKREDSLN